ncbi:hypothetical protein MTP99_005448 [Tenebrio molitor]|nr:hypothetical protein MTP99_005448 [Tenebrio molitor]
MNGPTHGLGGGTSGAKAPKLRPTTPERAPRASRGGRGRGTPLLGPLLAFETAKPHSDFGKTPSSLVTRGWRHCSALHHRAMKMRNFTQNAEMKRS